MAGATARQNLPKLREDVDVIAIRLHLPLCLLAIASAPVVAASEVPGVAFHESDATEAYERSPFQTDASPSSSRPDYVASSVAEATDTDLDERVRQLEARLNAMQQQSYQPNPLGVLNQQLACQEAGSGGLFGEIEVTFLRPHISGAPSTFGLGPTVHRTINSELTTGVRYMLGYKGDSGFGMRGRYWSQNDSYMYVPPFAPAGLGIEAKVADLELTLDQRLRNFDVQMFGGVRYSKLEYSNPTASLLGIGLLTFEGVGPTLGAGVRRTIGTTGISLFGNVRGSMLVGDIRNGAVLTFMPRTTIEEELVTIAENQLGIAWTHDLGDMLLEVRGAWETQYWLNNTLSDDVYGIGSNLGLTGPTVAVELKY